MNKSRPVFPTPLHQEVIEIILSHYANRPEVDSVLLLNSCARGQGTPQSDLDVAILRSADLSPAQGQLMEEDWRQFSQANAAITAFIQSGRFTKVHLDFIDGHYTPSVWDDGGGPDDFELEIGNHIAYSLVLSGPGPRFKQLQETWLPYYDPDLCHSRLVMVRDACLYDLNHLSFMVDRSLDFQAFDRLYKAFREFMQVLFIKQAQYPIAYNKWIYEQVVGRLGFDDLYPQLRSILSVETLAGPVLLEKAEALRKLVEDWI